MFNLSIDEDDDGNAAGRRPPPQIRRDVRPMANYEQHDAPIEHDPQTGEVLDPVEPFTIEMHGGTWGQFLEPLQRHILHARTIEEIDEWMLKNQDMLLKLKNDKPQLFRLFEKNIEPKKMELTENRA
jgi:hypothetical protein